jgi:hypothetical protein
MIMNFSAAIHDLEEISVKGCRPLRLEKARKRTKRVVIGGRSSSAPLLRLL